MISPPDLGPILLAIETASICGSLALVTPGRCLAEYSLQSHLTHSRRMLQGIETLLTQTGLDWPDIAALAVSLGPGSFTGLRIGLSTAKGLAMATGKPLIGVPTLDGLAAQLSFNKQLICPVLDARKKEVYAAFYRADTAGNCQRISEFLILSPEQLTAGINEPVIFIGDGAQTYGSIFKDALKDRAIIPAAEIFFSRAAAIGLVALAHYREQQFLDPATSAPIYVRPSEAELNFDHIPA
ncbi:MAG: tRNA (adenosine(37)-N6)-threonylcarbamoyltransferase complex dimerization subunit type 1 TsaB [Deltaproteobacteria bacterium RIFOXYD12_FULL_50_9]|nr:MAG: tRNA (adenosine(37)-N6)-threonylcarbamoyltransferase complex dimerization subunit type 1 TsaB [Deltaproteobacteria bacterium RIFOXYD12_FULL_50_9]